MSDSLVTEDKLPFFMKKISDLGTVSPSDDLLHPESFKHVTDDSATETQFFSFSVPEERIHSLCYMWHHPLLRVCSGGTFVFQGIKPTLVHAELCDWRTFMSDAALRNDLHDFRFANGYGVRILEPLKRFHITYADPSRLNSIDLVAEAVLPAVMWGDGNHFEQTMTVRGELLLRGTRYEVNCFTVRDRSWGKARPEMPMPMPPLSWMVGTFDSSFSFNCTMFDQACHDSLLQGSKLALDDDKALTGGWVYRDGKVGRVVRATKRVTRGPQSTVCAAIELRLTDEHGRDFDLRATVVASCPIQPWNNAWMVMNLMRWECDGRVGYGDCQEAFWGDYLHLRDFVRTDDISGKKR